MIEQPNSAETFDITLAKKLLQLESQVKGGTSWFYWIAGLSIINTIIFFSGGSLTFVVGLGATQFIDGLVSALLREVNAGAGNIIRIIGFGLDVFLAGVFVLGGVLGNRKHRWAVITGMVLYALDGGLTIAFGDWLSAIFHLLALFGLWRGQKAIKDLAQFRKSQSVGDMASLQKLASSPPPTDTDNL